LQSPPTTAAAQRAKLYRALDRMGVQLGELRRAGRLTPGSAAACPCVWREEASMVRAVTIPRYNRENSGYIEKYQSRFVVDSNISIRKFSKSASADADRFPTQRHSAMVEIRSFHRPDGKSVPGCLGEPTHAADGACR
jgi:hypothetical protein